jgi:hypothetical protein
MRFMEDAGRSGGDTKRYEREIKRFLGDGGKSMGDTDRYTEVWNRDGVIPERYGEMRKGNLCGDTGRSMGDTERF